MAERRGRTAGSQDEIRLVTALAAGGVAGRLSFSGSAGCPPPPAPCIGRSYFRASRCTHASLYRGMTQSQKSHNNISACGSERAEWIIIMRVLAFARVRIDTLGHAARACTRKAIARTRTRRDMWMCPHASIARMTKASYAQCARAQINRPGPRKARQ